MKKLVLIIILSLIFVICVWQIFVTPVLKQVTGCFQSEAEMITTNYDQMKIASGESRKKLFCSGDEESFRRLVQCLNDTSETNFMGGWVVNNFPVAEINSRKRLMEIIDTHNEICPQNPLTLPTL